jgi:arylsulfatase A-like enzyme
VIGAESPGAAEPAGADARKTPPNIILVLSDDHATRAMGCYGSDLTRTPNLDRLARGGMLFEACFCTESICTPSRTAILTGKYGHVTGGKGWQHYDRKRHRTFPEYLQTAGYQTAIFGKYHIGSNPPGFDEFRILPGQGRYRDPELISRHGKKVYPGHVSDVVTDLAISWMEQRDRSRPFLVCVQDKAAHMPWEPAERHRDLFAETPLPEPDTLFFDLDHPSWPAAACQVGIDYLPYWMRAHWGVPPEGLSRREQRQWLYQVYLKHYLRTAAGIDDSVGRLLDYVDQNDLTDTTVFVYSSDQGFLLGEHGLFDKRWMYEPSLRLPLIIRYPPLVKPGTSNRDLVMNIDFAPTLLALAGLGVPEDMQGRSLVPLLERRTPPDWRDAVYYRLYVNEYNIPPQLGIRTSRYKLVHYEGSGKPLPEYAAEALTNVNHWELFDLKLDSAETNNLMGQAEYQGLRQSLIRRLNALRAEMGDPAPSLSRALPQIRGTPAP